MNQWPHMQRIMGTITLVMIDLLPVSPHKLLLATSAVGTKRTAWIATRSAMSEKVAGGSFLFKESVKALKIDVTRAKV